MVHLKASALLVAAFASIAGAANIHPQVHRALQTNHGTTDIVIVFKQNTAESLQSLDVALVPSASASSRAQQIDAMLTHLDASNADIHRQVMDLLHQESLNDVTAESQPIVHAFSITSNLYVDGADQEFIQRVAQFESVQEIRAPQVIELAEPDAVQVGFRPIPKPAWGVDRVWAPQVWQTGYNGQNVIVGSIDSGVRGTHEALRRNFIGAYGWFDPEKNATEPYDNNGHGTHTMGTMVGKDGIGVAPGAKWMACKGCRARQCLELDLMKCFQFMTCPTDTQGNNRDCTKTPHVINNSWGGGQGKLVYKEAVDAWIKAGIIPVFSNGNTGPSCGTAGSPGDLESVIAVGAIDMNDTISPTSSKGPSVRGVMKPDIAAPGVKVYSSLNGNDTTYGLLSGTSMAAPHVTGAIALLLSAHPGITYDQVKDMLFTTTDTAGLKGDGKTCGSITDDVFPNHVFGHGRVNSFAAIYGKIVPTETPLPTTPSPTTPTPTTPTPTTPAPTTPPPTTPTPTQPVQNFCTRITSKFWCSLSIVCRWDSSMARCNWRFH